MEQIKDDEVLGKAFDEAKDYMNLRLELLKIETAEKSARLTAYVLSSLMLLFIGFFTLLFVSLVAGIYFSRYWDNYFLGFGLIGMIYLFLFLVILILKKFIIHRPVINAIIRLFFSSNETN